MTTLADERRDKFGSEVAALQVGSTRTRGDAVARVVGLVLLVVGVVAAFVLYLASLTLTDLRDLASYQLLATAFLALTVAGAAVLLAAEVVRVLRLWLVRQLLESRLRADQLTEALSTRD